MSTVTTEFTDFFVSNFLVNVGVPLMLTNGIFVGILLIEYQSPNLDAASMAESKSIRRNARHTFLKAVYRKLNCWDNLTTHIAQITL